MIQVKALQQASNQMVQIIGVTSIDSNNRPVASIKSHGLEWLTV